MKLIKEIWKNGGFFCRGMMLKILLFDIPWLVYLLVKGS